MYFLPPCFILMGHIRQGAGDCISISFVWKDKFLSMTHTFQWPAWSIPNKWDKSGSLAGTEGKSPDGTSVSKTEVCAS
jgi:hypothetical protein